MLIERRGFGSLRIGRNWRSADTDSGAPGNARERHVREADRTAPISLLKPKPRLRRRQRAEAMEQAALTQGLHHIAALSSRPRYNKS
jgi:hypothetical protein